MSAGQARTAAEELNDIQAAQALQALAELAAKLKETGLLDLLVVLAENYDEPLSLAANGPLSGLAALALAAGQGAARGGAAEAAETVERLSECATQALRPESLAQVRPVTGIISLLRELGDPRVARGLGLLIHLARSLGDCLPGAGGPRA
jgi:uncharacterized protein YjgD (DUF1641 family)